MAPDSRLADHSRWAAVRARSIRDDVDAIVLSTQRCIALSLDLLRATDVPERAELPVRLAAQVRLHLVPPSGLLPARGLLPSGLGAPPAAAGRAGLGRPAWPPRWR